MIYIIFRFFPRTFYKIWDGGYDAGHAVGWNAGTKHQQSTWMQKETR